MILALLSQNGLSKSFVTAAWSSLRTPAATFKRRSFRPTSWLGQSSDETSSTTIIDEYGRRIRRRSENRRSSGRTDSWSLNPTNNDDSYDEENNEEDMGGRRRRSSNNTRGRGGWDDFDPFDNNSRSNPRQRQYQGNGPRGRGDGGGGGRGGGRRDNRFLHNPNRSRRNNNYRFRDDSYPRGGNRMQTTESQMDQRINMRALEVAGFVHLYGLSSTLHALQANKRDFTRPDDGFILGMLKGEQVVEEGEDDDAVDPDDDEGRMPKEPKPEAQFAPWLFRQTRKGETLRSSDKASKGDQVVKLAEQRGIPVAYVDKGVLNSLSNNRPHQGYVLRCGKLTFETISRLPHPVEEKELCPKLWLALDEVVDPQNLGALLRSAYFLGASGPSPDVKVIVSSKNSAPPSPVVSASSAGALELMDVYSTNNLHKTMAAAEMDGYRVIGASSSKPNNLHEVPQYNLEDIPPLEPDQPTILILGSEGHGIRNLVATACTEFVRIPGGGDTETTTATTTTTTTTTAEDHRGDGASVDSLNVSVTGGILLWHLLRANKS